MKKTHFNEISPETPAGRPGSAASRPFQTIFSIQYALPQREMVFACYQI
jgi:hypothetical protein